jgi:hypothetical protein
LIARRLRRVSRTMHEVVPDFNAQSPRIAPTSPGEPGSGTAAETAAAFNGQGSSAQKFPGLTRAGQIGWGDWIVEPRARSGENSYWTAARRAAIGWMNFPMISRCSRSSEVGPGDGGALPPRPGHEPASEQRLAIGAGTTRAPARRPGSRTRLERDLDGNGDELRCLRVDGDVPAECR